MHLRLLSRVIHRTRHVKDDELEEQIPCLFHLVIPMTPCGWLERLDELWPYVLKIVGRCPVGHVTFASFLQKSDGLARLVQSRDDFLNEIGNAQSVRSKFSTQFQFLQIQVSEGYEGILHAWMHLEQTAIEERKLMQSAVFLWRERETSIAIAFYDPLISQKGTFQIICFLKIQEILIKVNFWFFF